MFWLSAASCVVAEVAIIRATLRVSAASAAESGPVLPHPRRWLEIVWVVLPAIALAALLVGTARAIFVPHADAHVFPPVAGALPSPR
jgi:heme/copper-type cytochrome/quinol oxidase subunit 2